MSGANMFIIYSSGADNVTVSPRLGKGEFEPEFNSDAQVTVLEGSGISSKGVLTANIRCDSCIRWDGNTMSPTSGTSDWIWSIKAGSAIDSTETSVNLNQHDDRGSFRFDLNAATSEDSDNPFLESATATQSSGTSQPSGSSGDKDGSSGSSGSSEGSSESGSNTDLYRQAHGIIMASVVLFLLPIGVLMMYMPFAKRVMLAHAPVQFLSVLLLIAGLTLGVLLGRKIDQLDAYHQIIGYIVVGSLVLFQPLLGLVQHLRFKKLGRRTIFGHIHRSFGRLLILLGIVNGGLGFYISGPVGSEYSPRWAVIAYSVVAAIVGAILISLAIWSEFLRKPKQGSRKVVKEGDRNSSMNGS